MTIKYFFSHKIFCGNSQNFEGKGLLTSGIFNFNALKHINLTNYMQNDLQVIFIRHLFLINIDVICYIF